MAGAPCSGPGDADDDDTILLAINTTPLVDVMLVLLIIFLITVPVINATVPVALPRQAAPTVERADHAVTITVDPQGRLYWDDTPLTGADELEGRLAAAADRHAPVRVRGDETTPFAVVATVIDACRAAGIAKVGFLTQPEGRP